MAATGRPSQRTRGVIVGEMLSGLAFMAMGVQPVFALVALGAFAAHFIDPFIFSSNQAIWQTVAPPALQGRVFAARAELGAPSFAVSRRCASLQALWT